MPELRRWQRSYTTGAEWRHSCGFFGAFRGRGAISANDALLARAGKVRAQCEAEPASETKGQPRLSGPPGGIKGECMPFSRLWTRLLASWILRLACAGLLMVVL